MSAFSDEGRVTAYFPCQRCTKMVPLVQPDWFLLKCAQLEEYFLCDQCAKEIHRIQVWPHPTPVPKEIILSRPYEFLVCPRCGYYFCLKCSLPMSLGIFINMLCADCQGFNFYEYLPFCPHIRAILKKPI